MCGEFALLRRSDLYLLRSCIHHTSQQQKEKRAMEKPLRHEAGLRTGWLTNYHTTSENVEADEGKESTSASALLLLFLDHDGDIFEVVLKYQPYFLVSAVEGHEREVELGITSTFGQKQVVYVQQVDKEDLDLVNHLSGKKRTYLKVVFANTTDLTAVRSKLDVAVTRNRSMDLDNPFQQSGGAAGFTAEGFFGFDTIGPSAPQDSTAWMSWIDDIREYDVKYGVRVAIDMGVYVGLWYDVTVSHGHTTVERCDDSKYAPAMPKVVAFDIETTKAPLKFPQPEVDQIYMISYMVDGRGYLIVNREIVSADIGPFEYTPKPEYEGFFDTFNEPDEFHTLRRFYDELKRHKPNVYVTYNGDYFDFPFIHARSLFHGMNMRNEIGFAQGAEGATLNPKIPHLDCFYWVNRDSYLPQGSRGLKAVTKYKLGYDPIEVDPEEMLPLAQNNPQRMASYSVSDAVSTYYLYLKYVHPFIFSLCTIIPMQADEVLRRGSGTLCESLLMVQAFAKNVVFPNKQQQQREKFFNGHLIDSETYIGGRVEALKSGVYRSNIDMHFKMNPSTFQELINKLDDMLTFAIEVENGTKRSEVTNYDEVKAQIKQQLESLRDRPDRHETPLIYHLDVGAMYPNIILTNRLQPSSMVTPDICAGCCFNTPDNDHKCKRDMTWVWKGEMFTANRHEFTRIKAQLESESFTASVVAKADIAAVQKKTYGNRKGNVLEGTTYEKKDDWKSKKKGFDGRDGAGGGGSGYRQMNDKQRREANSALLHRDSDDDGGGSSSGDETGRSKQFHKLEENTQFSMLKKRLGEYSRRAYGKAHESREIRKSHTVCQRENSFYVDTVRLFRDRRYLYKAELKKWKTNLDKAKDPADIKVCKSRCVQMESLQLAHKCILNSFYGYVMRKGSRWYSMEMAGIVTYLGATLIQVARALVQQIGETLELDTDGIWCCLPKSFPENFTFTTDKGKKIGISYPCVMLNKDVHDIYTNHQYQEFQSTGAYSIRSECSIYFEVDGPYLAMILPASREEGKTIKKRYAVFHPDGRLAELKGFELKRRGELMLIKDFQSLVFKSFLDGSSLKEAFDAAAVVANSALDLLFNQGDGYDPEEVVEKLTESSNMSRRLAEYPETQKSLALTTARRIAEFLGPQMVKDKGLACHFVISRLPHGKPVTERTIPLTIFKADPAVRVHFLRKWTGDNSITVESDLKSLLDWNYYIARFNGCVQKIITIPAALQGLPNPVPRVPHPEWLDKKIRQQQSRFKQKSLDGMLTMKKKSDGPIAIEDLGGSSKRVKKSVPKAKSLLDDAISSGGEDVDEECGMEKVGSDLDDETENIEVKEAEAQREAAERLAKDEIKRIQMQYFTPSSTRPLDSNFFGDPSFGTWLGKMKDQWLHRAKLRKDILGDQRRVTNPADTPQVVTSSIDGHLVDAKSKALSLPWHILEVREANDASNTVKVFAVLDRNLFQFRCAVERVVVVDAEPSAFPDRKQLTGKVLPRHASHVALFEVTLGDTRKDNGDDALEQLKYLRDDVHNVYEGELSSVDRFVLHSGCVATVRASLHLQSLRDRHGAQKDLFQLSEFDISSSHPYLTNSAVSLGNSLFVYHVGTDTRGILALIHQDSGTGVVVLVQPAQAQRVAFQWTAMAEEALQVVGQAPGARTVAPKVVYEETMSAAWRVASQYLVEKCTSGSTSTRPILAVVQSPLSDEHLMQSGHLPYLHNLPIVRTMGSSEDEKLLTDVFRWSRLLPRRMLQRLFASMLWLDERLTVARVAGVPICNFSSDVCVSALDILFRRQLRRRGHVLWDATTNALTALEQLEERPRQVVAEAGHHSWCVEFSLSRVDVIAVLFSQMIQERDDPRAHVLGDRGVTSHFHILRDMLSDLMGQVVSAKRPAATLLLVSFSRWIRDTSARAYEPRLVELISTFVHRALTALLIRITKLGGKVVKANGQSLIVASSKLMLRDAIHFSNFLCTTVKQQPLLSHLHLQPVRYWAPLIVVDHHDYIGMTISHESAIRMSEAEDPDVKDLTLQHSLSLWSKFNPDTKELFVARLKNFFELVLSAKREVMAAISSDTQVTLATKAEKVQEKLSIVLCDVMDRQFQSSVLEEVTVMLEKRVPLLISASAAPLPGGTDEEPTTAALEYTKLLCYFLELMPGMSGPVRKTKNNCLRVCGVSPFAPSAIFRKRAADSLGPAQLMETRCSFCNEEVTIDVMESASAKCPSCLAPFTKDLIEAELVRRVGRLMQGYCNQDYICTKCRQASSTIMSQSCCGSFVGKVQGSALRELRAIRSIAQVQQMPMLLEAAEMAVYCLA